VAPGFLLLFLLISQTLRFEPSIRVSPDSMAGTPDAVVHEGRFMCVVWRGRAYLSYSLDYGRSWRLRAPSCRTLPTGGGRRDVEGEHLRCVVS